MLVRHLLHQRLAAYYAQSADAVVGSASSTSSSSSSSSLQLSRLCGELHWKQTLARLYKNTTGQWLTPVELFQPYYSNTIANFIASSISSSSSCNNNNNNNNIPEFDIVELGGGRGTNALCILNHLQQQHPHVYDQLQTFYIIDASPSLHQLQRDTLLSSSSSHASLRVRLEQKNLVDVAEGRVSLLSPSLSPSCSSCCLLLSSSSSSLRHRPTIVVACEVLDNLPHDKIQFGRNGVIQQAEIMISTNSSSSSSNDDDDDYYYLQEVFCPLQDALIQRVVDSSRRLSSSTTSTSATSIQWIPTVACGVLEQLQKERPNFGLVLADFDWLPPPNLLDYYNTTTTTNDVTAASSSRRGRRRRRRKSQLSAPAPYGEPLVTSMQNVDYPCYLSAPPMDDDNNLCDILFPTDFDLLANFIIQQQQQQQQESSSQLYNNVVQVQKQADFLQTHGPEQVEQTKSWLTGYSPLVDDFANCSVLTMRILPIVPS